MFLANLVDSDFRNGLFKLTALLIHNTQNNEHENEFTVSMMNGIPNKSNMPQGRVYASIDCLGRSFVVENPLDREMVHALVWLPVKMFTTTVMEAAVDCWAWAIVGRPELELLVTKFSSREIQMFSYLHIQIVEEIYKVWEKVISDRHGLYSVDKPEPSPLAPSEKEELKPKPPTINPHRIFFKVRGLLSCIHPTLSSEFS